MKDHTYYVYMMTCASQRSLYIGVTNGLKRRVRQHKEKAFEGFTSRYNIDRLVYYEVFEWVQAAIAREKQLKGWSRKKKLELVRKLNPGFHDLSEPWFRVQTPAIHTFGDHISPGKLQDASTANPELNPDSSLSMTRVEGVSEKER